MKKLGLVITAAAVLLFMVGCASKPPTTAAPTYHSTYHSKLGSVSATKDTKK